MTTTNGRLAAVTTDPAAGTVIELPGALTYTVGSSPSAIVAGDFNGDGRPDVATANAGSNSVSVLLNDGTFTPPPPPPPPPPPHPRRHQRCESATVPSARGTRAPHPPRSP